MAAAAPNGPGLFLNYGIITHGPLPDACCYNPIVFDILLLW